MEPQIVYANFDYNGNSKTPKSSTFTFCKDKSSELFNLMADLLEIHFSDEDGEETASFTENIDNMFVNYGLIQSKIEDYPTLTEPLNQILDITKSVYKANFDDFEKIKTKQELTYGELKNILMRTKYASLKTGFGQKIGVMVTSCQEQTLEMFNMKYLYICYKTIYFDGASYLKQDGGTYQMEYKGKQVVQELPLLPMTPEEFVALHERGKIYHKLTENGTFNHMQYTGNMLTKMGWWEVETPANGRIMIDVHMHKHLFPNDYHSNSRYYGQNSNNNLHRVLSYFDHCMLPSNIHAFSFEAKKWGKVHLENIKPIVFDDSSYDKLVMQETKKDILKTLILNSKFSFTDIVKGKSGGCIFLLHGTPGTGKTLTAETISETLHKPLYSITSGELGTDVVQLETKLTQILEMIQRWDAIILVDEADVFLEKRDTQNLTRNAIVCVFLRLLEKYSGIMFLTTNRKTELDHAFQSRISLTLEYNDLSYNDRLKVWQTLLKGAKIELDDSHVREYALYVMNGRNIKNVIRLANALSIGKGVPTQDEHFKAIFDLYIHEYKLVQDHN